jgi:hypothetical protein
MIEIHAYSLTIQHIIDKRFNLKGMRNGKKYKESKYEGVPRLLAKKTFSWETFVLRSDYDIWLTDISLATYFIDQGPMLQKIYGRILQIFIVS